MKNKKSKSHPILKHERKFTIPNAYCVETLARDLSAWLETEHNQATECEETADGWLIQSRDTGGRFSRMVKRKAGRVAIGLICQGSDLTVGFLPPIQTQDAFKAATSKFGLKRAASLAASATVGLADATVSGLADIWVSSEMQQAIHTFIRQHIVAFHKQSNDAAQLQSDPQKSRYVEPMSDIELAWVAGFLAADESLIAWLRTATPADDAPKSDMTFVLTTHKAVLAAFSKTGLESLTMMDVSDMAVTDVMGRDKVTMGDHIFRTQLQNDMLFREIAPLVGLSPFERLWEAARLNHRYGPKEPKHLEYARTAIKDVMQMGDNPLAALSHFFITAKNAPTDKQTVAFLDAAAEPPVGFVVKINS